jgi:hypothetical protein
MESEAGATREVGGSLWRWIKGARDVLETLRPIITWVGPFLAPWVGLWLARGTTFFKTTHPMPGWVIALATGAILVFSTWSAVLFTREHHRRRASNRIFLWHGLEWELTRDFWGNLELHAEDLSDAFTKTVMRGPFCAACKTSVTSLRLAPDAACATCGAAFDLGVVSHEKKPVTARGVNSGDPIQVVRWLAYLDAQGAARRRET